MSEWHYYTLPLPVVAPSGSSMTLQQMITNAFGYTPANWIDFWITYYDAAQFVTWNLDYWEPSAPVHGAWLVNGGDIGSGLANQTYVGRPNLSTASLTTGNIIGPYAYVAIGIAGTPYDVYMQYSLIAVDPDMMRADATTRAPVAQDIIDAANRLFTEYGYSFNDNDCHYIAAHVGAAAGAVFADNTQSLTPNDNEEYGFWRIAYRGTDPGAIAQWQTLLQPGDIVRMGWTGGGTHTYTVLAVNPNGTVQVYDNTYAGPNGGGIGVHTVNYDDITIASTITVYRLTTDGTFLINGMDTYGERLYGSNYFNDRINGLSGNDYLFGAAGNDILDGGSGNDVMDGGAGDDTFYVDNALDSVVEGASAGTDHTYSSLTSTTLAANVENLTLTGGALNGNGNALNNIITGNGAANVLLGVGGNDTLSGGDGDDELYGRQNNDTLNGDGGADDLYGGDGDDVLNGGAGDDVIDAGNGADRLDGGLGADALISGAGADTFVFSSALGGGNVDSMAVFVVADDTIELSVSIFSAISLGALAANAFVIGAAAADGDDRIIYDPVTGALSYDADGAGGGAAVQFATLATGLALTAADFVGGPYIPKSSRA